MLENLKDGFKTQRGEYKFKCLAYSKEVGAQGTPHLQGFAMLDKESTLEVVRKWFCNAHISKMLGSIKENEDYCSKVSELFKLVWEDGLVNPHPRGGAGARNDLEEVKTMMQEGASKRKLASDCFSSYVKYHAGFDKARNLLGPQWKEAAREFIVLEGDAGSGKSWRARQIIGEESVFVPSMTVAGRLCFADYDGEQWILLDDFLDKSLDVCDLKRMTDRYACTLPGRNTRVNALHKGVIVTSNYHMSTWYSSCAVDSAALQRRLTEHWSCKISQWQNQLVNCPPIPNPCPHCNAHIL